MTERRWNPYDRGYASALERLFRFLVNPNVVCVHRSGSCLAILRPAPRAGFFEEVELEWKLFTAGPPGPIVSVAYDPVARTVYISREPYSEWVGAHARAIELSFEREAPR